MGIPRKLPSYVAQADFSGRDPLRYTSQHRE
jgi:hypothetical protein